MKKKIIGYTGGVFDLFHIGHLNLLKTAKSLCDELIVWVCSDDAVYQKKGRYTIFPFDERVEILQSVKYIDRVIMEEGRWALDMYAKYPFDIVFKGDDWKGSEKWNHFEQEFEKLWVKVVYLPYTKSTSSTLVRKHLEEN